MMPNKYYKTVVKGKIEYIVLPDVIFSYFSRTIALLFIKPVAKTSITANQISLFSIVLALFSAALISISNYVYTIIACVILQIVLILDCMDGVIARYKGQTSYFGQYLESLFHNLVPPSLFFALGVNSYKYLNNPLPLYLGGITVLLIYVTNTVGISKESIILSYIQKSKKIPPRATSKMSKYVLNKPFFGEAIFLIYYFFNSPGYFFTILLVLAIFNKLYYATVFYTFFFLIITIFKGYLELKQGFKPYGLK